MGSTQNVNETINGLIELLKEPGTALTSVENDFISSAIDSLRTTKEFLLEAPVVESTTNLFVSMLMPFHDQSGVPKVLGIYSSKEKAQARCWREIQKLGYDQPTEVFECTIDEDRKEGETA